MPGKDVNPKIVENYDGKDIILNSKLNIVLSPSEFKSLNNYRGSTLITTDGTTLLGADDKAGIAEIVTAAEYMVNHPEIKHGDIKIGFTPDEEVGGGTTYFDVEKFGADFAYTLDGGGIGELEYENFNAARADIVINGKNTHPGSAKDVMKNSITIAMELNSMLPENEVPEKTSGYEGFYHLHTITGGVDHSEMKYILRDFNTNGLNIRKETIKKAAAALNRKYGPGTLVLDIKDQYNNMIEKISENMHLINNAKCAIAECGIEPVVIPIRGGTDGARLSFMGLPCPNLFTGGHNFHGRYEYICVESMKKAVDVIIKIAELYGKM
jgi:tripeptide aminopeptidase